MSKQLKPGVGLSEVAIQVDRIAENLLRMNRVAQTLTEKVLTLEARNADLELRVTQLESALQRHRRESHG